MPPPRTNDAVTEWAEQQKGPFWAEKASSTVRKKDRCIVSSASAQRMACLFHPSEAVLVNQKSIGCTVERTQALGGDAIVAVSSKDFPPTWSVTTWYFGVKTNKVNTMVFWTAWCMASGRCSFPRVRKNQPSLQDQPFSIRRSNFRATRADRDPIIRRFMALCAPVILTNSAVGVQEPDYHWHVVRSNNPIRVTCSRRRSRQCRLGIFKR